MGWPVVIVASGGIPVTETSSGLGTPLSIAANGFGTPVTVIGSGGLPVVGSGGGGGGGTTGPGDPVTVFYQNPALGSSDANPDCNFRVLCTIAGNMRDEVRLTVNPGDTNVLTVPHIGIGEWDGVAGKPDTKAAMKELRFAAADGFASKNTPQVSDWLSAGSLATMLTGSKLVASYHNGPTLTTAATAYKGSSVNSTGYYKPDPGGTNWSLQNIGALAYTPLNNINYGISRIETRNATGGSTATTVPPIGFNDPIFTGMSFYDYPITLAGGYSIDHISISEQSGNSTISCTSGNTVSYCRVYSREAVRISGSADFHHCYFEAEGIVTVPPDHADCVQHYAPGTRGAVVTWKYSHVRNHLTEATATYFIADNWDGSVSFDGVVFESGPYGLLVKADPGCNVNVSLRNCYFVGPFGSNHSAFHRVKFTTTSDPRGTINIALWDNVRLATISGGVLTPGALIPTPTPVDIDYTPTRDL